MAKSTSMTFKLFGHDVSAGKTFKNVGQTAAGVATGMGAAFAASKLKDWAKDSLTAFDNVGKESLKLQRYMGGSIEDASRLGHAFRMTGIDSDKAGRSLGIFSKNISGGSKAFEELGVATMDAQGKTRDMKDVLMDVADKFKNMPAGADRTALAIKLFGKAGADMLPFLSKGSEGIQELMKQSDALGTTMSGKDGQAVKDYTKSQREFKEMIYGVQISLGRALYPTLTHLGTTLLPMLMPKVGEFNKAMGKLPALIEQKWPIVQQKIKEVFDEVGKVEQSVRRNWPAIKDMFVRVGDALKRVGEWTRYLWEKFQSLPAPVKEFLAMLAIAQKTGVLSIAFKGLDLAKNLVARIAGMSVQAGVVNVNGVPGKGGGAAPVGKAGWAATIAGFLGSGTAVAALVAAVAGIALAYYVTNHKTPGETAKESTGTVNSQAGSYGGLGGANAPDWSDKGIAERQKRIADLATAIRDETKARIERIRAMQAFRNMGIEEIRHLKDTGASTDEVRRKIDMWKASVTSQATALGWTQEEIGRYIGELDRVPSSKETKILADTTKGSEAITGIADKITGILDPPAIHINAEAYQASRTVATTAAAVGAILNPKPIRLRAVSSEVHSAVGTVIGAIGAILHPPPIKINADGSQALSVIDAVRNAMNTINSAIGVLTRRTPTAWRPPPGSPPGVYVPRQFASGGIVRQATLGIVGEAGPEAVIPLNRARGMIGGTTEVHVHVSGSVFATKEQMAREVVAALQNAKNRGLQLGLA